LAGLDLDRIVALVCDGSLHVTELSEKEVCLTSLCFVGHSSEDNEIDPGYHEITLTERGDDLIRIEADVKSL
jgi:hypothetical protein